MAEVGCSVAQSLSVWVMLQSGTRAAVGGYMCGSAEECGVGPMLREMWLVEGGSVEAHLDTRRRE